MSAHTWCSACQSRITVPGPSVTVIAALTGFVFFLHCPLCGTPIRRGCPEFTARLLLEDGARYSEAAPDLAPARPDGPPLNYDDLLDFHQSISGRARLVALLEHEQESQT